jgi:hypothetical protein
MVLVLLNKKKVVNGDSFFVEQVAICIVLVIRLYTRCTGLV